MSQGRGIDEHIPPPWLRIAADGRAFMRNTDAEPWREIPNDKPVGTPPLPCACGRPEGGYVHGVTECWSDKDTLIASRPEYATAYIRAF